MPTSVKNRQTPKTKWTKWTRLALTAAAALLLLLAAVLAAKWFMALDGTTSFLQEFQGHTKRPEGTPAGFPAWLGWQHFLNTFFLVLIIRTGWQIRTDTRPNGHWTRNNRGFVRTKRAPTKISLDLWLHLTLDVLWILNGIIFVILLFMTGHWQRIVPTSWDIVPNALSAGLQYLALDWPTEDGWVNYNALQLLAYFVTVFMAAPLAFLTGLRMSPLWPKQLSKLNRMYPIEVARALHFPVMIYFVGFVVVHVALVLATGALRNLNHMYASSNEENWTGFWIFGASLIVMVAAWFLTKPLFLRPVASLTGSVTR
ncbi:cytochrome b/b6 domain-containing protein [Arthrobacter rhizosphaerae]|uniref:cytochrome b/b6 domain-containing protein n=1 Tax=Arthrobacter rhizosphaerae TaxID=2855490 RepID=UPI001FF624A3|nr:cytochrome b/b6 domain-containing protein [Arthrobacter rhizosphaerae]